MSSNEHDHGFGGAPTETMPLESPANVASRLRKVRLQQQLFGAEQVAIKIDRFTMLERIGSGGMGEIYAAYDERLDRKVAIKLVRAETAVSPRAQARLLREARALAKLSHPNVVQVYDAGTFEGRVFIAMEFVRGTTLRRWLEEHATGLTSRARVSAVLSQFLAIGRGLVAAHAAGVVHRDFKPDNVLVGDDGRPRVVDFGLAHAVLGGVNASDAPGGRTGSLGAAPGSLPIPRLDASTHGHILGTPRYMSPEQMRGQPVDGRSDQFSFCVALYHALYGDWPFAGNSLTDIELALENGEVTQPSQSSVPAAVRKALLRGLAREPEQRFPSMEALLGALQLERHRRHQRLLGVSGLAAVVGLAVYTASVPEDPCAHAGESIRTLWNAQLRDTLASAFERTGLPYAAATWHGAAAQIDAYTDRWAHLRHDACEAAQVRREESAQLLDRRMVCLDRGQRRLHALLDAFTGIDARALQHAAGAVAALPELALCENLEAMSSDVIPPEPRVAEAVRETRDRLAEAETERLLGDYGDAATLAREALARAGSLKYDPVHADALHTLGWVLVHHGTPTEIREGEALMMRASNLAEGSRYDQLVASVWNDLTLSSYQNHATTEPGHAWAERALAAVRRMGEPALPSAQALRHLGLLSYKDGRFDAAEAYQRQALGLLPADVSPLVHALHLKSLATTVRALQRDQEALSLYQQALDELAAEVGDQHPLVADACFDLATFLAAQGSFDRAVELMTTATRVYESTFGNDHPRVGLAHLELADIERNRGALAAAHEHALRARAIYERAYDGDAFEHARVHEHLGAIAFRQGKYEDAVSSYRRALDVQIKHRSPGAIDIGFAQVNLAEAQVQLGQYDEALASVASAAGILSGYQDEIIHGLLDSQRGQALLGKGRHAEAVTALESAVARFGDGTGTPAESAAASWALAHALDAAGRDRERANALARKASALYATQGESTRTIRADIERWLRDRN